MTKIKAKAKPKVKSKPKAVSVVAVCVVPSNDFDAKWCFVVEYDGKPSVIYDGYNTIADAWNDLKVYMEKNVEKY